MPFHNQNRYNGEWLTVIFFIHKTIAENKRRFAAPNNELAYFSSKLSR